MRFGFFLGEALGSLRRNWVMTMAAVITVFISTVILGVVLVTGKNLDEGATSLKNRVMIEVFIKDETTPQQQKEFEQRIGAMPEVKEYAFVSKDEALERFQESYSERITANLPINPLPASYEIYVKDADQVDAVAARFYDEAIVDHTPGTQDFGQRFVISGAVLKSKCQPIRRQAVSKLAGCARCHVRLDQNKSTSHPADLLRACDYLNRIGLLAAIGACQAHT